MKRITIIALMSVMFLGQSHAQNKQKSQSGKTVVMEQISPAAYATFKVSNNILMYKVSFQKPIQNERWRGHLFIPKSLDTTKKHAAIIVGHPMGAVKEAKCQCICVKYG